MKLLKIFAILLMAAGLILLGLTVTHPARADAQPPQPSPQSQPAALLEPDDPIVPDIPWGLWQVTGKIDDMHFSMCYPSNAQCNVKIDVSCLDGTTVKPPEIGMWYKRIGSQKFECYQGCNGQRQMLKWYKTEWQHFYSYLPFTAKSCPCRCSGNEPNCASCAQPQDLPVQ